LELGFALFTGKLHNEKQSLKTENYSVKQLKIFNTCFFLLLWW